MVLVCDMVISVIYLFLVRDRQRTKMERDILADVNHPFIVKLHYGKFIQRKMGLAGGGDNFQEDGGKLFHREERMNKLI